ncbi:hypothetical protein [Terricaulis sp.]|uniref:hypothetical protein n=1 Tax=Terricaulis sp. TaxID=2768686 RepID=UPI00378369C8
MRKLMFGGATAVLILACPVAFAQTATPATPPAQTQATPSTSAMTYTDAQLRSYAAASAEVEHINSGLGASPSASARTQADTQIGAVLQRNNLDRTTYDAIAARARTDTALSARIAALRAPTTHSQNH